MHLDIKPDNVGIDKHGRVRLLDASHSRLVEEASKHPFRGTYDFAAPEMKSKAVPITALCDVFSVGRTFSREVLHTWLRRWMRVQLCSVQCVCSFKRKIYAVK